MSKIVENKNIFFWQKKLIPFFLWKKKRFGTQKRLRALAKAHVGPLVPNVELEHGLAGFYQPQTGIKLEVKLCGLSFYVCLSFSFNPICSPNLEVVPTVLLFPKLHAFLYYIDDCFPLFRIPKHSHSTAMSLSIKIRIASSLNLNHGTSKITTCANYNTRVRSKPIYIPNPLFTTACKPRMPAGRSSSSVSIRSSLIEPDGGTLVDLVVPESQRASKTQEAESLPKVKLTKIDLEWVHVISEGWASPLRGFMREDEYLQSLHFNSLRMKDGPVVNLSLPIVLAIDEETKGRIGSSSHVSLVGPDGDYVAILRRYLLLHPPVLLWSSVTVLLLLFCSAMKFNVLI